jgi:SEC-C motif-containing protein
MRSRYSAHVKGEVEYIKSTMVPSARKDFDADATREWSQGSKWKGLKILSTRKGGPEDSVGTVEFVATYERNGRGIDHHEVSQFEKSKEGQWFFVDGEAHEHNEGEGHHHPKQAPVVRESAKLGRNDPCHCGSGKKFKKCCG